MVCFSSSLQTPNVPHNLSTPFWSIIHSGWTIICSITQFHRSRLYEKDKCIQWRSIYLSHETKPLHHSSSKLCFHLWFILFYIPYAQPTFKSYWFFSFVMSLISIIYSFLTATFPLLRFLFHTWLFWSIVFLLKSPYVHLVFHTLSLVQLFFCIKIISYSISINSQTLNTYSMGSASILPLHSCPQS